MVHEGKYGFYPCDWATYRKLKELNMAYDRALHLKAQWERWDRKEPQNRVIRAKIKDSADRVVGYQVAVPMAEPEICPVFCRKFVKRVQWDKKHLYHKDGKDETFVEMIKLPIYEDYRKARYPAPAEEACGPLSLKLEEIDELHKQLCK